MSSYPSAALKEELEAQAHIWNQTSNVVNSMSLLCAVQLGIADAIHGHGKPMSLSELVAALPIDPSKSLQLRRLMRLLAHSRFFSSLDCGRYDLTAASRLLLRDNPHGLPSLVATILDPAMTLPWNHLSEWFRSERDATPFVTAHGVRGIWDHRRDDSQHLVGYNRAMACDSRLVAGVLLGAEPPVELFAGVQTFVDVGGSTGTFAREVAAAFPQMECVVLDLPHIVAGLEGGENLKFVAGDMFEAIPPGDALLLKWIFPVFGDEESVKILAQCKKAIASKCDRENRRGKVIIIDIVVDDDDKDHESVETKLCFDLLMMLFHNGRERSEKDWAKILYEAGFSEYKITPCLGLRSVIEVYP